jgi:hypothetical protein
MKGGIGGIGVRLHNFTRFKTKTGKCEVVKPDPGNLTQKPFIYKTFRSLQECPFNARRVPLNVPQFSKNWQLRPCF